MEHIFGIQAALSKAGLDAVVLTSEANRRYATGFPSSWGAVVVTRERAHCFTDSRYIEAARQSIRGAEVSLCDRAHPLKVRIAEALDKADAETVGAEEQSLSYREYTALQEALNRTLAPAQMLLSELRAVKDEVEIAAMRRAQAITDETFHELLSIIRPGMTERELAAELIYRLLRRGAEGLSFEPIVAAGERGSMPHATPSDRPLRRGEFVTMDFGCIKDGYCSDMTRTVALGRVTEEMERVYYTVLAAQTAGIAAAFPGARGCDVHNAAAAVLERAGYGAYFGHSFGHSLGLEVHENPNASPSNEAPLPAGAVISAEPGVYLPGRFGVRIEDVIVIRDGGAADITASPRELVVV